MIQYDVLIIGGGAAGLSAAVTLARSLRTVLVVDAGQPRNAPAHAAHNLLGREGINPHDLLALGRQEARAYSAEIVSDEAVRVRRDGSGFVTGLASGREVRGRRLLLATGLVDELPAVPGLREQWGSRVLHCPYCHGYEVRGQRIAVLVSSPPMAVHQALLFRQLSEDVTVLLHEQAGLDVDATGRLQGRDIPITPGAVECIEEVGEGLDVVFSDGRRLNVEALVVQPRMNARGALYAQLGGQLSDHPMGHFVETGLLGRTPIDGVWAAGNVSDLSAMVSVASGEGTMAAAAINADLAVEPGQRPPAVGQGAGRSPGSSAPVRRGSSSSGLSSP